MNIVPRHPRQCLDRNSAPHAKDRLKQTLTSDRDHLRTDLSVEMEGSQPECDKPRLDNRETVALRQFYIEYRASKTKSS